MSALGALMTFGMVAHTSGSLAIIIEFTRAWISVTRER
jgi:hypothetical protein